NGGVLEVQKTWSSSGLIRVVDAGSQANLTGSWSSPGPISAAAGTTVDLDGTVNNRGITLALSGGGVWHLNGTISGGTVALSNGAKLLSQNGTFLDGVTLDGDLDLSGSGAQLHIGSGLI